MLGGPPRSDLLTGMRGSLTYVNVINIHNPDSHSGQLHTFDNREGVMPIVAKLDELGRPAWILLMILGFMVWWPVGLMVRAGCGNLHRTISGVSA